MQIFPIIFRHRSCVHDIYRASPARVNPQNQIKGPNESTHEYEMLYKWKILHSKIHDIRR